MFFLSQRTFFASRSHWEPAREVCHWILHVDSPAGGGLGFFGGEGGGGIGRGRGG